MSEAKEYAARNRQGNDWFAHAGGPAPSTHAASTPPTHPVATPPTHAAPPPTQDTVSPSSPPAAGVPRHSDSSEGAPATGRAHMIKPTSDSNQWYKYDNSTETGKPGGGGGAGHDHCKRKPPADASADKSGDWFTHEATGKHEAVETKQPVNEADSNSRRNKQGTSSDWFAHDHATASHAQSPRVTSKEGGDNASRMRGESENWFNHDANKTQSSDPVHMSKGRTARPQNNEMHDIFHSATAQ